MADNELPTDGRTDGRLACIPGRVAAAAADPSVAHVRVF